MPSAAANPGRMIIVALDAASSPTTGLSVDTQGIFGVPGADVFAGPGLGSLNVTNNSFFDLGFAYGHFAVFLSDGNSRWLILSFWTG